MIENFDNIYNINKEMRFYTQERIVIPIVQSIYDEFIDKGAEYELLRLISVLPKDEYSIISNSLSTHVTREKSAWITQFYPDIVTDKETVAYIGAVTELLWTIALIIDDIEDNDKQRANMDSVWVKYGREKSYSACVAVFQLLQKDMNFRYPILKSGDLMKEKVDIAMNSLKEHSKLSFNSSVDTFNNNYYKRAIFHANFPFEILFNDEDSKIIKNIAIKSIQLINNSGQLLNDMKDIIPNSNTGKEHFGDIRNGTITIPLKLLYDKLASNQQLILSQMIGKELSKEDKIIIDEFIKITKLQENVTQLVIEGYQLAFDLISQILSKERVILLKNWIEYKTQQALTLF
jgi:hypothetical protein